MNRKTFNIVIFEEMVDVFITINHQTYIKDCLQPLLHAINLQRPNSGTTNMKFHHDNARPHVHKNVVTFLQNNPFTIIRQPPYSPDLAPSDYWLFDYIKCRLEDHASVQSLHNQITRILSSIPASEYRKTFEKWQERMQLCINNNGDYFEHLINKN